MLDKLPNDYAIEIAQRVRRIRKGQKLSQSRLAEKSGVSLGSLKRFESSGKISLESLLKLALILNCLDNFNLLFEVKDVPQTLDDLFK